MSKTKSSEKVHYELLYIIPNKFTDDEAKAIDEKIKKSITDAEGEITYSEDWGKKKLAYQIENYNHGYYKLVEFDLTGVELAKIDNSLRLSNDVLRHQIIKTKKRTAQEIEKDKKQSEEFFRMRHTEKDGEKPAEGEKVAVAAAPVVETLAEEEKKGAKKKTDLKDLDKKLDDILDADDLI
jgi:small subunit ribosomal protein S6